MHGMSSAAGLTLANDKPNAQHTRHADKQLRKSKRLLESTRAIIYITLCHQAETLAP